MNQLDQLRDMTTVVADTGDIDAIRERHPTDATTNPSLLLKAAQQDAYRPLLEAAINGGRQAAAKGEDRTTATMTRLAVNFGCEILKLVPGRVSTEVDARLSFDRDATVQRAEQIIQLYSDAGVSPERILIKIASTWEGIAAATLLEKRGIHCNMTLLFHFAQAQACADAGATLISPFVGRITDWYKAHDGVDSYAPDDDPGVQSVRRIYGYYKQHGFPTEIMGASFRNIDQIRTLAGCDLLTISPDLMDELAGQDAHLLRRLSPEDRGADIPRTPLTESDFRWAINDDAMATEKLAEGIRRFAQDTEKLAAFTHTLCNDCP